METRDDDSPRLRARLLAAPRYRGHSYGDNHPLGIPRVSLTIDLIEAFDAITEAEREDVRAALPGELEWFHSADYIDALRGAERFGKVFQRWRDRYNFGNFENPYLPDMYATPATATFASILGAEHVLGGAIAFNPAGGMHHARASRAQGFCYLNDPALGILRLRQAGMRVLYLDLDVHHGDGVEIAFADDPEVLTMSIHMDTESAYPFGGGRIEDVGRLGNAVNVPLPPGTGDRGYDMAFSAVWPEVVERFGADVIVLQAGTDAIFADPLGRFELTTQMFLSLVQRVIHAAPRHRQGAAAGVPRLLVLGGGGYHPLILARAWAGLWALISGRCLPEAIPQAGQALLRAVDWDQDEDEPWFDTLFLSRLDRPMPPEARAVLADIEARIERLLDTHPLWNR
ncbi:MAG: acetoin utilization protein AcuC [Thioalkalivibrionaceae bacterium]